MAANENKLLNVFIKAFPETLKWEGRSTLDVGLGGINATGWAHRLGATTWALFQLLSCR